MFQYRFKLRGIWKVRSAGSKYMGNNMHTSRYRGMTVMTLCALVALVSAQVTFSRDWSGGKRSPPTVFDCGQLAKLCRHFLHDLRQAMADGKLPKHRRLDPEEVPVTYEDEN